MSGSSQAKSTIEPWIDSKGAEYPIFIDDGGATARAYGVRGIPHCALIGPDGKIAYKGHPGSLKTELVEKVLANCVLRFEYEFPAAFKSVQGKIAKKDFAGAYKALDGVQTEDEASTTFAKKVRDDLDGYAKDVLARANADTADGDYLSAEATLKELAKQYKGTPAGTEVDDQLKAWKKDPLVKKELKAGKLMLKAKKLEKAFNFRGALGLYVGVTKKFKGTKNAEKAQKSVDKIQGGNLWKIDPKCRKCKAARAPCDKHK